MKQRVLFVCMGNICRSPTAHGVFQQLVNNSGLTDSVDVDSAGTGAWHAGAGADKRAAEVALKKGYDLSDLRARELLPQDFEQFDYILGMDLDNMAVIDEMKPASYKGHASLFLDFANEANYSEVPDPYYGGGKGFELVLSLVEDAALGLLSHIKQHDLS